MYVQFSSFYAEFTKVKEWKFTLTKPVATKELLEMLVGLFPELAELLGSESSLEHEVTVIVDRVVWDKAKPLPPDAVVGLYPPIAGG